MVKLHKALVILPGDFPGEPGGYAAVCRMLGLVPNSLGYAIYLAQTAAGSVTLVGAELGDPAGLTAADAGDDAEFPNRRIHRILPSNSVPAPGRPESRTMITSTAVIVAQ